MKPEMKQVFNVPKNEVVTFSFKYQIPVSSVISKNTQDANVFKDIHSTSIISLEIFCEDGCTDIIDKTNSFYQRY